MDAPLPGYPQPFGTRWIDICTHQGPTSYPTGGETVNASTFGFGSFDHVNAGSSFNSTSTGTYVVRVFYPAAQTPGLSGNSISGGIPTGPSSVKLQWLTAANSTEVANNTNLATEFVRVAYYGG